MLYLTNNERFGFFSRVEEKQNTNINYPQNANPNQMGNLWIGSIVLTRDMRQQTNLSFWCKARLELNTF